MPVPSTINDLSATAGSNYPQGSDTPSSGDDVIRAISSFVAQLRDKLNGTSSTGTLLTPTITTPTISAPTITGDTNARGVSISRIKTSATARSSTTTLASDPDLVVPLGIGSYSISLWVPFFATTSGAGGFKMSLAYSSTSTDCYYSFNGWVNLGATDFHSGVTNTLGTVGAASTISTGSSSFSVDYVKIDGVIITTGAGNLSFQWAQNSSNANATNVGAGAWISCEKLS